MQQQNSQEAALTEGYVKDLYNTKLRDLPENYTKRRWFHSVESTFDYEQTKRACLAAVGKADYQNGLEVGPGDGVWTAFVAPQIETYDLLDQSEEMLARAKETLSEYQHITYTMANFAEHTFPVGAYNFVLSVRCFEYITDKAAAIKKFYEAMAPGGKFVLITKNPHYKTLSNWKRPLLHTEQMGKQELTKLFTDQGFEVEAVYPAVMRWKSSYRLFRWIFDALHRLAVATNGRVYVPWLTDRSTESYTYVVRKKKVMIELYGLSGGGKSTLAKELAEQDPAVTVIKPQKRGRGLAYFMLHNPGTFFSWIFEMLKYALVYGDHKLLRHRLAILLSTFEAFGRGQQLQSGIVVLDEGLFQRVFSIYERRRTPEQLTKLIRRIPQLDQLLLVNRNEGHFDRYKPSTTNPRAQLGESYMSAWKEMILHNHANMQTAIRMNNIPVTLVDTNSTAASILTKLKSL